MEFRNKGLKICCGEVGMEDLRPNYLNLTEKLVSQMIETK